MTGVARLNLTLACGDYDRTRAIRTGEVKPDGVELNVVTLAPEEMFYRMARFREFDVSELSLSTYTVLRGRGEPLVAIPVFPSSSFRHSSIFVGTHAGIKVPKDLVGKRIGVPKYHMTAAVWIRGMLEDEYGVAPRDMLWFEGGEGSLVKEVDVTLPPDVRHPAAPHKKLKVPEWYVSDLMLDRALDAILRRVKLDRRHDIPYLAGYSEDGKTIYIDRHMPKSFKFRGRMIETDRFLVLHEEVEKTLIDQLGLHYLHAHQIATRAEQAAVRAAGIAWRSYDRFMQKYVKRDASERLTKVPADLDTKPYRDEHDWTCSGV